MFGIENYTGFILAAIILNLTSGIDTIYILTRSISQGKNTGMEGTLLQKLSRLIFIGFGLKLAFNK